MILSIITPYYDRLKEIKELAKVLEPQLNDRTEWIIVDDGCKEIELDKLKAKVIHLEENSGGASVPRNVGIDNAEGEYITFIDSDDLVSNDYINKIINKINISRINKFYDFDYCYFSWKWLNKNSEVIIKKEPPKWNCSVWNCIYKKEVIDGNRFKPELKMAEDYDFNARVRKGKRANIVDILYYYNDETPNSLTKQGKLYNEKYSGRNK